MRPHLNLLASATCLLLVGCAPDLRQDYPFDGASTEGGSHFTFEDGPDGTTVTQADATSKEFWAFVDLDGKQEISSSDAIGTKDWDLGFQRFKIVSNGGVSGVGDVEVAVLPNAAFDAVTQAPATGYMRDSPNGNDVTSAFTAGDGWYAYDILVHKVLPRDNVYVVHTSGGFYKLKILSYYDQAGTGAKISFQWAKLAP